MKRKSLGSKDGGKKRRKSGDEVVVLIVIGSSSGVFPKLLYEAITKSTKFSERIVLIFPEKKIYGMNGATEKVVLQLMGLLERTVKKYPKRKIFFLTSSFGGRAAAHALCQRYEYRKGATAEEKHPRLKKYSKMSANVSGIVSFGYPLNHKSDDRSYILTFLKHPILFLVGSKDKRCDIERLESLINKSIISCDASLHVVEGGKHNPFDIAPKSSNADGKITNLALHHIEEFIYNDNE